ncbi:hypothetical protein MNV49_002323 [Pseudohyphozyma bogoriensis]|nr:hypothetical protein MNV49_002323 [Pseudohyphozyma bogoriensis]
MTATLSKFRFGEAFWLAIQDPSNQKLIYWDDSGEFLVSPLSDNELFTQGKQLTKWGWKRARCGKSSKYAEGTRKFVHKELRRDSSDEDVRSFSRAPDSRHRSCKRYFARRSSSPAAPYDDIKVDVEEWEMAGSEREDSPSPSPLTSSYAPSTHSTIPRALSPILEVQVDELEGVPFFSQEDVFGNKQYRWNQSMSLEEACKRGMV